MSRKLTIEVVRKYVEENSECKLASTKYINTDVKMLFVCKCGNEFEKSFDVFKRQNQKQCPKCGQTNSINKRKKSFEYVKKYIESNSKCKLISTEYVNDSGKLDLVCECGNAFQTSYGQFRTKNQRQCQECGRKIGDEKTKLTYDFVKNYIETESECKLSSTEYIDIRTPLMLECDCGRKFKTSFTKFKDRNRRRCLKCSQTISSSEYTTGSILKDNCIEFIPEHRFNDCRYIYPLIFDFYLPKYHMCIELDGQQHFEPQRFGGTSIKKADEKFKLQLVKDNIKDEYCRTNNIKLLKIPYWEFNNIEEILKDAIV